MTVEDLMRVLIVTVLLGFTAVAAAIVYSVRRWRQERLPTRREQTEGGSDG